MLVHNQTRFACKRICGKCTKCNADLDMAPEVQSSKVSVQGKKELDCQLDMCCITGGAHRDNLWNSSWNPHNFEFSLKFWWINLILSNIKPI